MNTRDGQAGEAEQGAARCGSPEALGAIPTNEPDWGGHPREASMPCLPVGDAGAEDTRGPLPNDSVAHQGSVPEEQHGQNAEDMLPGCNIEHQLGYDDVVTWILHDLTKTQMNRFFLGMKILGVVGGRGPQSNPIQFSKVNSVEAFDRYMDAEVEDKLCGLFVKEVKVVSDVKDISDIPPVLLLMRPLQDAITCAFAHSNITPGSFTLQPQSSDRVNNFMQGSCIGKAQQVIPPCHDMQDGYGD